MRSSLSSIICCESWWLKYETLLSFWCLLFYDEAITSEDIDIFEECIVLLAIILLGNTIIIVTPSNQNFL